MSQDAIQEVKQVTIDAVVIRADGTREDLGTISNSKWSRFDPRRLAAKRRTERLNRDR